VWPWRSNRTPEPKPDEPPPLDEARVEHWLADLRFEARVASRVEHAGNHMLDATTPERIMAWSKALQLLREYLPGPRGPLLSSPAEARHYEEALLRFKAEQEAKPHA